MALKTADEIKAANQKTMGQKLGEQYSALWQDVAHLHSKWGKYCSLFGDTPEKIEIFNKVAPELFREIDAALWRDVLLHIARLTDPEKMGKKENLTLLQLPSIVSGAQATAVEKLVADVLDKTSFCRDWRNRHIAHNDLEHSLDNALNPLAKASRKKVRGALDSIALVMNSVNQHYNQSETLFDHLLDDIGGDSLVWYLTKGLEKRDEERSRKKLQK